MNNGKTKPPLGGWGLKDDDFDFLQVNEPKMFYGASNIIFENAKQLRNRLTESEKYYGNILRKRNLE
ncbi:hypothetical protein [Pedobacter rhodius]|uniref:Uncharacterized protein n=1 Tax=Pedobacter rhodius TaxID=3004098 RepID=A0ABT4KXA4_9SPHI|nr:hypothetical protein [Pedobacter sp. SJ11]MCZ4223563.1 hypothetical protein [Pedobacter sp. SJ11]